MVIHTNPDEVIDDALAKASEAVRLPLQIDKIVDIGNMGYDPRMDPLPGYRTKNPLYDISVRELSEKFDPVFQGFN